MLIDQWIFNTKADPNRDRLSRGGGRAKIALKPHCEVSYLVPWLHNFNPVRCGDATYNTPSAQTLEELSVGNSRTVAKCYPLDSGVADGRRDWKERTLVCVMGAELKRGDWWHDGDQHTLAVPVL